MSPRSPVVESGAEEAPPSVTDLATPRDVFARARRFTRAREVEEAGLYPYFAPIERSEATEVVCGGRRLLMLGSNNYLGLTSDPRVIEAAEAALRRYGSGCTGSRFLNGNTDLHDRLEDELATLVGKEAALVYSTGYHANLGTISALVSRTDAVFIDKLDHASILDGCQLSQGQVFRYRHGDLDELEAQLRAAGPRRGKLIAVDGVFSMDGDIADLERLARIRARHGARLLVDEAHAVGVLGPRGGGTAEHFGLTAEVDLIVGTFSKSFASIGGFVASDADVVHYLRHSSRPLIFSASMPPSACASVLECLEILASEPERRERLFANSRLLTSGLDSLGFDIGDTTTPIIPVMVGDDMATFTFWRALFEAGVFTNAVVAPAVPEGAARIRVSCIATHTEDQLSAALDTFARVGRALGVI